MIHGTSQTPGMYVRILRVLLGLSREEFCKQYDININTLTSIELDRIVISKKQKEKLAQAFTAEGLTLSEKWLEEAPQLLIPEFQHTLSIEHFFSLFPKQKCLNTYVADTTFLPFYDIGDFLYGVSKPYDLCLQQFCLVEKTDQNIIGMLEQEENTLWVRHPILHTRVHIEEPFQTAPVLCHLSKYFVSQRL